MEKKYHLSKTVINAFDLLTFIGTHQPITAKDITASYAENRTRVHRLLTTLEHVGYVTRRGREYVLSYKIFKLGSAVPVSRDLRDVAKPYMRVLMEKTHENVYINILVDDRIIAIDEVKSSHHLVVNPDLTYIFPIHVCASAKLLLGAMESIERKRFLDNLELTVETENTVTSLGKLLEMVDDALRRGYALEIGEYRKELNSLAAPIYDYRNKIVATISVSGPAVRLTRDRLSEIASDVCDAGRRISEALGQT